MAQGTRWGLLLDDFFSTFAESSKLYWMCPPDHRLSDCVSKIWQDKLQAIVVGPKWTHRGCWNPLMEITLQGHHLPGPDTKASLYQDYHFTLLPKRGWSTVAICVDAGIAKENWAATNCHVAPFLAPVVPNPDTIDKPGMTSEEDSDVERGQITCFRCTFSHTKRLIKTSSLPLLLTPPRNIWKHKNASVHTLQQIKKTYWAGGPLP